MERASEGTTVDDEQPSAAAPAISRRRLLAAGALAGTAAALAACGNGSPPRAPVATATHLPSAAPGSSPAGSPPPSASPGRTSPPPSLPPDRDTGMRAENALRGDPRWDRSRVASQARVYLGLASVGPGEPLALRAAGSGTVNVEWYRLGWYDGMGARLLGTNHGVKLRHQRGATVDPVTGMVEARWTPTLQTTAPTGVRSGMLLAVLRTPKGHSIANVPIVLRPDPTSTVVAPVLFVSAACTWQAYNTWGGLDLYANSSGRKVPATSDRRSAQVSFDRPYGLDAGAGYLRRWELQFIRWMERNDRDVEYIADLDLERHPELVSGRRMIVMAGHPEYWSRPMRTRLEAAIASGTNVAFLTGNEVYWQTRLEDGPSGPATRITCYKSRTADPITATAPGLTTCRWREPPVNDPEAPLVGEMYGSIVRRSADWVVAGHDHWLYEGTGLQNGDAIANLVGQEFDTYFPGLANPGTVVLANGPVNAEPRPSLDPGAYPSKPIHNATAYTAQSGATVVAAGTFQWSWALDEYGDRSYLGVKTPVDDRVGQMTRNLFDRLGDGPLAP